MARAAWTGLIVNTLAMALAGLLLGGAPSGIAGLYSSDPRVIAAAVPLVLIVAATMIGDGGQRVLAQSLRATHDAWFPTALHLISYAAIMVPLGLLLARSIRDGSEDQFAEKYRRSEGSYLLAAAASLVGVILTTQGRADVGIPGLMISAGGMVAALWLLWNARPVRSRTAL